MRLSQDLEIALTVAVTEAGRLGHEYAGPEHLLYALTFDAATGKVLRHAGADLDLLRRRLSDRLEEEPRDTSRGRQGRDAARARPPRAAVATTQPRLSLGLRRALEWAGAHAEAAGKAEIQGADVLVAMLSEVDSQAAELLASQGVTRLDVVSFLAHGISKLHPGGTAPVSRRGIRAGGGPTAGGVGGAGGVAGSSEQGAAPASDRPDRSDRSDRPDGADGSELDDDEAAAAPRDADEALAAFTLDLTELARRGGIDPLIGREIELARTLHILRRRRKNNPIYVGDPGVGKTALVEGLALRIAQGDVPAAFRDTRIYRLDLGALLAGTRYRGDFENRLKAVLAALAAQRHPVLFIDEIHNLIGAGSAGRGTMDASNLLKPALQHGGLRCIGATTWEEFRQSFERDQALARRFQKVEVMEPSVEETVRIFGGLRSRYEDHHGVRYTDPAVAAAAELASRYLRDRRLPDSAIDLLDEAGATVALAAGSAGGAKLARDTGIGAAAIREAGAGSETSAGNGAGASGAAGGAREGRTGEGRAVVDVPEVESVLATMAQIPARRVQGDDRERLRGLREELEKAVFGQDEAVDRLVAAIQVARAGLRDRERPVGCFLLTGPTGVGKTEMARQLGLALGISFLRFDMSEYMERHTVSRLVGAPPGYVGFDRGGLLTEAVAKNPHAVLLLDEVEKAHEDVFNLLLQVMDHGTLTDTNGKRTDFRHVILLMTSNLGAREMARRPFGFAAHAGHAGDDDADGGFASGARDADAERAYERLFSPEFRNRLDAKLQFRPLSREVMEKIVDKLIAELAVQLEPKAVRLELTPEARRLLAERGYDPVFGARPLARVLDQAIKQPLTQELLFGALQAGGTAVVGVTAAASTSGEAPEIVVTCRQEGSDEV